MKKMALLIVVGLIVSGLPGFVNGAGGPVKGNPVRPIGNSSSGNVLGVDQFMTNVSQFKGPVIIEGVASGVFPKHQMVALIDMKEFKACGVTTCANLTLPIQWTGQMPRIKDIVHVTGQVQRVQGKMVFVANQLAPVIPKK